MDYQITSEELEALNSAAKVIHTIVKKVAERKRNSKEVKREAAKYKGLKECKKHNLYYREKCPRCKKEE